ncbi:MAG: hypothetical protein J3Q66DRAFT_308919 [Benniella sp.]|nr:MAG: hypothetical protein J3Q66DRAFT_308919 [Benniella sp.]
MIRALSKSSFAFAALAQRQTGARIQVAAALSASFHTSSCARNNNEFSELLGTFRNTNTSNSNTNANNASSSNSGSSGSMGNRVASSLFGSSRDRSGTTPRNDISLFSFSSQKANTTSNPIHIDINHPTEGRSFRVNSAATVDQTYRRLRVTLNQAKLKREIVLKRAYETGHVRMRRERQERNKKLFGAMVQKKINLIKLMKSRGM